MKKLLFISAVLCFALLEGCDSKNESTVGTTQASVPEITTEINPEPFDILNGMPNPFSDSYLETGGDELGIYYDPYNGKLSGIDNDLIQMVGVDEFTAWGLKFNQPHNLSYSLHDNVNLYSFMTYFNISDEKITEIIMRSINLFNDLEMNPYYTLEDIEVICSHDEARIMKHFTSDFSICADDKVLTPAWVYSHTLDDYKKAGLSAELIQEKTDLFVDKIPFTQEAKIALENKVNEYMELS